MIPPTTAPVLTPPDGCGVTVGVALAEEVGWAWVDAVLKVGEIVDMT